MIRSEAAGHAVTSPADARAHRQTCAARVYTQPDQSWGPPDGAGRCTESRALCFALLSAPPLGRATPRSGAAQGLQPQS